MSLTFWGRYPRPARLAFLGCLALFLVVLVTTPVQVVLPWIIFQRGGNSSMVGFAMFGVGLVRSLLYVGGFGLLLAAAFARRSQQAPVGHEEGRV